MDTDRTKVVAAGIVQDLVRWVSGGCSSDIQYVLSVGAPNKDKAVLVRFRYNSEPQVEKSTANYTSFTVL